MAHLIGQGPAGAAGPTSVQFTTPYPHALGAHMRDKDGNEYVFCKFITTNVYPGLMVSIDVEHQAAPLLGTAGLATRVGVACGASSGATAGTHAGWVQVYGLAFAQAGGSASSTDDATICAGTSVSDADTTNAGVWLIPQTVVTTPSGTLTWVARDVPATSQTTLLVSDFLGYGQNVIHGMWMLKPTEVSNLSERFITEHYDTVTSPVSVVSSTSNQVTLTTKTSGHIGVEVIVFLNYPYVAGVPVS